MRWYLRRRVPDHAAIEAAIRELVDQGYLDDARYAQRFVEDRRTLDGWGSERIARRLAEAGIASDLVDGVLAEREEHDELSAAVAILRRRLGEPPGDDRGRERALGLLVRRGYELELAYDAVQAFASEAA
jgi:regulatory protein